MPRVRLTGFSLALVTVAASLAVPAVLASASSAATSQLDPRGRVTVTSHKIDVTTSTGRHVQLLLNAAHGEVTVALANSTSAWHEQHAWSFNVLPAMRYDKVDGKGWVRATKSQLHRYGAIDLTVRQTEDWAPVACDQGTAATARVHIKGTLFFNTHSGNGLHPWGRLGTGASDPITIDTHGEVQADHGCQVNDQQSDTFPCIAGTVWTQRQLFAETFTFRGQDFSDISTFGFHLLPHTQTDGVRIDLLDVNVPKPTVTQTPTGVVVDVTTPASSQRVTGSATISATGAGQQQSEPCGTGTNAMTDTSWTKATLANDADPLTVHPDLGRPMVAHEGGGATIDQITVGPAPSPSPSPSISPTASPSTSATRAP